ncbi:hypothetical protein GQ457_11G022190 [Hibiscus cannabinus]
MFRSEDSTINPRYILLERLWLKTNVKVTVICVYAPNMVAGQIELWNELLASKGNDTFWVVYENWTVELDELIQKGLKRSVSYRVPVLLTIESVNWGPSPFKFIDSWLSKVGCRKLIKEIFGKKVGISRISQSDFGS